MAGRDGSDASLRGAGSRALGGREVLCILLKGVLRMEVIRNHVETAPEIGTAAMDLPRVIAFDSDDTLWHNEILFSMT